MLVFGGVDVQAGRRKHINQRLGETNANPKVCERDMEKDPPWMQPFFLPWSPKIKPKHWYLRCFCNTQKSTRSKNTAICDSLARQHVRNAVFYSVFEPPLKKNTGIYSAFRKHMHKTPQIATNSKIASSMATRRKKQKHRYLQRFCAMIFAKKLSFWTIFGFWSLPKQRRKGTPPPPFHSLNFKICTESKTKQFLELETRPGRHFLTVFTTFFARA